MKIYFISTIVFILSCNVFSQDFPMAAEPIELQSPATHQTYQKIKIGETHKAKKNLYWRYITFYNEIIEESPVPGFPWFEEECFDESNRFANWSTALSFQTNISAQTSLKILGFDIGIEISKNREKTIEFQRWIQSSSGIAARHTLYQRSVHLKGESIKQFYNSKNGDFYFSKRRKHRGVFKVQNKSFGLFVRRDILQQC